MRIFSAAFVLAACIAANGLSAETRSAKGDLTPSTPTEIYQNAQRAAAEGRHAIALELLEIAAKRGVLGAQIQLARIRASGVGGARDDAKAFHYYKLIADGYADIDRRHALAHYIAEAFREAANYLRNGIESAKLKPDAAEASRLMLQAASYFHDRIAQYELATMYLAGEGVEQNPTMAVKWLMNSARKRYAPALATLGDMLWRGKWVKRSPAEGLAFLAIAAENAAEDERALVHPLYANALAEADLETIRAAEKAAKSLHELRDAPNAPLQIVPPQEKQSPTLPGPAMADNSKAAPGASPTEGFALDAQSK